MTTMNIGSIVLWIIGILILIVSAFADLIGLGEAPGFGAYQIIGSLAGAIIILIGLIWYSRKKPS